MSVIDDLRSLILAGRYAPGDRLGEVELAQLLQVSRTPVREALRQLQSEGLVEVTANKGARVVEYPAADLETIFELRARIEGLAARQAAALATDEDADHLHEVAVSLGDHAARGEIDAVYRLNAEFHQGLVRLSGSTVLAQSISALVHSPILLRTYSAFDEEAMRRTGSNGLDILINNIGGGDYGTIETTTPESYDHTFSNNVRAPFFLTQALLPRLREGGRIINIASRAAFRGDTPEYMTYAASKGGLVALTRSMIGKTNAVEAAPGTIRSDFAVHTRYNLIHGSDTPESAEREIANFFRPEELVDYELDIQRWI